MTHCILLLINAKNSNDVSIMNVFLNEHPII